MINAVMISAAMISAVMISGAMISAAMLTNLHWYDELLIRNTLKTLIIGNHSGQLLEATSWNLTMQLYGCRVEVRSGKAENESCKCTEKSDE